MVVTISIKSLLESGKSADEFASVTIKYDGKYEYNTFSTIEENGGADFSYTNITSIFGNSSLFGRSTDRSRNGQRPA